MKRFYKTVSTTAARPPFHVLLDGKPIRTPLRRDLDLPNWLLAQAIAVEWGVQEEILHVPGMRLTRLATTVIDLLPERREPAIQHVLDYLGTDMLCYRASHPNDLVQRQTDLWQPWLNWLERAFDVRLPVVQTVLPAGVEAQSLARMSSVVGDLDPWRLVALHAAVTTTGSLILGLAMVEGVLNADEAFKAAALDDLYSIEHWGTDPDLTIRHDELVAELEAIGQFVTALAPPLSV